MCPLKVYNLCTKYIIFGIGRENSETIWSIKAFDTILELDQAHIFKLFVFELWKMVALIL